MIVSADVVINDPTTDLQAAVNATPAGGSLYLGPGTFVVPDGGLQLNKPIEFCGDMTGTHLVPFADADYQPIIVIGSSDIHIHHMRLIGLGPDSIPTARQNCEAIRIHTALGQGAITNVFIDHLQCRAIPSNGIDVNANNGAADAVIGVIISDVSISSCSGHGVYLSNCTVCSIKDSYIDGNGLSGLFTANYAEVGLFNVAFEGNCQRNVADNDTASGGQCVLNKCHPVSVVNCHFESFNDTVKQPKAKTALSVSNCNGLIVSGCLFVNGALNSGTVGIKIRSDQGIKNYCQILPNTFDYCDTAVQVDSACEGISVWQQDVNDGSAQATNGIQLPAFDNALKQTPPAGAVGTTFLDAAAGTHGTLYVWNGTSWRTVVLS